MKIIWDEISSLDYEKIMTKLKNFNPNYRQWRDAFDNELRFTRREYSEALQAQRRELEKAATILGVKRVLPNENYSFMMKIVRIERSPEGIFIVVE